MKQINSITRREQSGFTLFELIVVLLWVALVGGYAANFVKLIHWAVGQNSFSLDEIPVLVIMRIVGVFTLIPGAILGYF